MIYPSLHQSLEGMLKDDEDLSVYLEHYTQRLEQITVAKKLHATETQTAIEFIFEKKLLFPKEIDYAVLICAIEDATEELVDYDSFNEPELPEEINGISEEDEP